MTPRFSVFVVALLAFASGCSDPQGCGGTTDGALMKSEGRVMGSHTFSTQGERASVPLTFTLGGLAKQWPPDGPVVDDRIALTLGLSYAAGGPSGVAEMPSIGVSYGGLSLGRSEPYPPAYGTTLTGRFFNRCRGIDGESCCEEGSGSCTLHGTLDIERVDGQPFPPLDVTWDISARAGLALCFNDETKRPPPTLELESP